MLNKNVGILKTIFEVFSFQNPRDAGGVYKIFFYLLVCVCLYVRLFVSRPLGERKTI